MTVKELIEKLSELESDRLVIVACDPEGNSYDTLYGVGTCAYDEISKEVGLEVLTEKDEEDGYGEEDVLEGGVPAVCLRP